MLEDVHGDHSGPNAGLGGHQHGIHCTRPAAGPAAHLAFVQQDDPINPLFHDVEGGAQAGDARANDHNRVWFDGCHWHPLISASSLVQLDLNTIDEWIAVTIIRSEYRSIL